MVAVPDTVTLLGVMAPHVRPGVGTSVNAIVPVNPFWAVAVIVELADWPAFTPVGEDAVRVKSGPGGARLRNLSRQPHPWGVLEQFIAP